MLATGHGVAVGQAEVTCVAGIAPASIVHVAPVWGVGVALGTVDVVQFLRQVVQLVSGSILSLCRLLVLSGK